MKTQYFFRTYGSALIGVAALAGVYLSTFHSYLLFHSIAESFSLIVLATIFIIAWNARRLYDNAYLLFVGIASLFIAALTLLHMLAYKGMGVFPSHGANLPTQLWVALRGLDSLTLLVASLFLSKKPKPVFVFSSYAVVTAVILNSIFVWHNFPMCFSEESGGGLTLFKKSSEYVVGGILLTAYVLLWRKKKMFDPKVFRYLSAMIFLQIAAGLTFTQYISVYGQANMIGHLLHLTSFYCLYKAVVQTALAKPYNLLFRELKQREEQLLEAQQMQELMTQFLVHDLRSPLTSMVGGIATFRDWKGNDLTNDEQQLLDGALASTSWLMTLTNALLDSSRLENEKFQVTLQEIVIRDVINSAVEQVSIWAKLCDIRITVHINPEIATVYADQNLTTRVLVNLLSNAIKHSPTKTTITIAAYPKEGGMLVVSIQDEGEGIPQDIVERVFDKFVTTEVRKAGATGAGLGLYFCKLAVEAQGGTIWLESKVGEGTTFYFTLPIIQQ